MKPQVDLTLKVIIISIFLTTLLAVSNTYLALKVGLLTAASIPAAILSMGIMKFFRSSTIYEHNLVQTAASSGEAIAGGVGYTLPALVIIGFAHGFNYIDTFLLALLGGIMGVLFSAIIRRPLLEDKTLRFPEGQAISEVLKLKEAKRLGVKEMLFGGGCAAFLEFLQSTGVMFSGGVKILSVGTSLVGLGVGVAPALIGAGYIIGIRVGLSLFVGAVLSYVIILPALSHGLLMSGQPQVVFDHAFSLNMRYVGVGGMLFAALVTLLVLIKPLYQNVVKTLSAVNTAHFQPLAEQDLSKKTVLFGLAAALMVLALVFNHLFGFSLLGLSATGNILGVLLAVAFVLVVGFIIAIVCGYFSGLVGVSASPGSSALIGALIAAAFLIHGFLSISGVHFHGHETLVGEAITIIIASVVMQIACISNDTMQDLKVGHIIGASPRKQQIMLIFGVLIASLIVPLVMEVLYRAYGIAGAMPHPGMNPNDAMAAPPAAIMAALTGAIFSGSVPLKMLGIGAGAMLAVMLVQRLILRRFNFEFSYIGVGIGMYLSLPNSMPLVIGAILSYIVAKRIMDHTTLQKKVLLACGLVAGAALMDVFLAIPVAINPDGHQLQFNISPVASGVITVMGLLGVLLLIIKKNSQKTA